MITSRVNLHVAGIPGFLDNRGRVYDDADDDVTEWRVLCEAWFETFGSRPVGSAEVFALAVDRGRLTGLRAGRKESGARTAFGVAIRAMRDRVIGEYRIKSSSRDMHQKRPMYALENLRGLRGVAVPSGDKETTGEAGPVLDSNLDAVPAHEDQTAVRQPFITAGVDDPD